MNPIRFSRARLLYDALTQAPELVERADDIERLPQFVGWRPEILAAAIDDLVDSGSIAEAADGRLCVVAWRVGQ